MKKIFFCILALWAGIGFGQNFHCQLDGRYFSFDLVTDQIFVQFNRAFTGGDLAEMFGTDMMVLKDDGTPGTTNRFIQLNDNYSQEDIGSLIDMLNANENVVLASPLLQYQNTNVGMSTQLVVKLNDGIDPGALTDICQSMNIHNDGEIELLKGFYSITIPENRIMDQLDIALTLFDSGQLQFAEPNFTKFVNISSYNDPFYSSQYALTNINANGAWGQMGTNAGGSSSIKIAVLDCGVQTTHPDLASNCVLGFDATYNTGTLQSQTVVNTFGAPVNFDALNAHGTACAGIIAAKANNNIGIVGIAYNCKIVPIRIGEVWVDNNNATIILTNDVIEAIAFNYAKQHADVISCSWGGGTPSSTLTSAITDANNNGRNGLGCPVFFAAGNSNSTIIPYPAYLTDVICVGATDNTDMRAGFSNYSVNLDITAPGDNIETTDLVGADGETSTDYASFNGTSFSCPYAAGLMALILSVNPAFTQAQARNIIESTCDKVNTTSYSYGSNPYYPNGTWSNELGYGRINANNAISVAKTMTPPVSGPFSVTVSSPTVNCYNGTNLSAYFKMQITGGNPYTNQWNSTNNTGYQYYFVDYYSDAAHTIPSPYRPNPDNYVTQSTIAANPNWLNKNIYLDLSTITSFPATLTLYADIYSLVGSSLVHHYTTITVTVNHAPDVSVPNSVPLCYNQTLYLGSYVTTGSYNTPGNNYTWNLGNYPNTNSITYSVPNPVIYNLTYSDQLALTVSSTNGCTITKTVNINVSNMQVSPAITTIKKCVNASSVVIGPTTVLNGLGGYTYQWTGPAGLSSYNTKNPTVNPAVAGVGLQNYSLTITDYNGCTANFVYPVDIKAPSGSAHITSDFNNGCPGHDVLLTAKITAPYLTYTNGTFSDGSSTFPATMLSAKIWDALVTPYVNTTYTFTADDPYGCPVTGSLSIHVNNSYPLTANAGPDVVGCAPIARTITGSATLGQTPYSYQWLPQNTTSPSIAVPNSNATYTLIVTDANGCRSQDQVHVSAGSILFANSWTFQHGIDGSVFTLTDVTPSGGTPPYSYSWTPSELFTNPTTTNPTTIPLHQTVGISKNITDANGCKATYLESPIMILGETPLDIYPGVDVCSGKMLTINPTFITGGVNYLVANPYSQLLPDYTGVKFGSSGLYYNAVNTTYTFSPTPFSILGDDYTFNNNVNSVNISVHQTLTDPWGPSNLTYSQTYNFNFTFPPKDNSRNNMLYLSNVILYVGTDQLLHKLTWNSTNWIHEKIMPSGGWGNVRVEGWLAANSNNTVIYFKGTDQKMYVMTQPFTNSPSIYPLTAPVNVKSDIVFRGDGVYFIGSDNLVHRFNLYNIYEAFTPINGWGSLTATGHLAVAALPLTSVAFLASDNIIHYISEISGDWYLNQVPTVPCLGETIFDQNGSVYFKNASNRIEVWDWNWSNNIYTYNTTIGSFNDPNYSVDGYMIKDPNGDRIFYKGNDGAVYNIYKNGNSWDNWPLNYGTPNIAGDLRLAPDGRLFYIGKDKKIHEYDWNSSSGWSESPMPSSSNVKACSYNFKEMEFFSQDSVAISESEEDIRIYPNPTNGILTVDYQSEENYMSGITVTDVMSRMVKTFDFSTGERKSTLDLHSLDSGIYFINVYVGIKKTKTQKIVLNH